MLSLCLLEKHPFSLGVPEGDNPPPFSEDITAEALVDIKKFAGFLHSNLVRPTNVILCLLEQKAVVAHVLMEDLFMTYLIPILLM